MILVVWCFVVVIRFVGCYVVFLCVCAITVVGCYDCYLFVNVLVG